MIRVALVDDQPLMRGGVAMALESQPDMTIAWQADDGAQAVAEHGRDPVDVIVMDVRMPVMDGIEATARICGGPPDVGGSAAEGATRVLMLTTFDLDEHVFDALRAGASGFLLKDAPAEELIAAVRHVAAGDAVLAPATTARLIREFARPAAPRSSALEHLSERELEVTRLIARGLTNPEIAATLFVSETTVKTHVRSILRKLDARDRVQVVIAAYESGLV